jgi:phosphoribosylformylglycinamidine synthase
MPKSEILDPQGKAVLGALPRLGFGGVTDVRQGKRFEVEVDGEYADDQLVEVRRMAETLLANPVIEDFTVHRADDTPVGPQPPVEPEPQVELVETSDPDDPDPPDEPVDTSDADQADPPDEPVDTSDGDQEDPPVEPVETSGPDEPERSP